MKTVQPDMAAHLTQYIAPDYSDVAAEINIDFC